ncbi:ankyrin repeat domain containing protein [Purpureocillium lavendulum]|uniref:Ankyrin repeat domain containing protein n=1 Tax=Purpureocillium lavendulum TaxID=1247861 RepID=A0AB34FCP0_9HYPO|nr:ankyrin repeat domain containing protein [Purpureocillium lavendulum]
MNGPELPQILKQVEAISTAAAQASQDFSSLHSPATEYEANWTAIQAKLDNAWERGLGCSSLADRSDIQKEIVTLAHAQEALKAEYEANLEAANSRYEARLNRVLPRLCEELVQILGPILVEKALRDLFRATDAPRDGSPGDPEDANPQDDRPSQGVKVTVLLLPTEGLDRVGVHNETIETLGLLREVPLCYDYNPDSGSLNWRQGYRDGEALVPDREYPVMYFDGNAFPTRSQVGWVAASDLLDFDLKAIGRTIPNYRQVRKYLEMRDQGRPQGPNTPQKPSVFCVNKKPRNKERKTNLYRPLRHA